MIEDIIKKMFRAELKTFKEEIINSIVSAINIDDNPRMLLDEASKYLGISEGNLKTKFQKGLIKGYKPVKEIYFFKKDLIKYIQSKGSNELI